MSDIIFEQNAGVACVTFNRGARKNALTVEMCEQLMDFVEKVADDDTTTRVLLLRATGEDFSTGADIDGIAEMLGGTPQARVERIKTQITQFSHRLFGAFDRIRAPIVTSFRGHAVGAGMQLVLASDLVIASETARFILPNVWLAHTPDHGETYLLPRKVGLGRAMQIALLGEAFGALEAERYGLVNFVTPDAELEARTDKIVAKLAAGPREALQQTKALLKTSLHRTYPEQFVAEREACGACAGHSDFVEAITAFTERRKPRFETA